MLRLQLITNIILIRSFTELKFCGKGIYIAVQIFLAKYLFLGY